MIIIGINAYHGDSSACIFVDGLLLAAIEEERLTRVKHWAGLPIESVKYCLNIAGLKLESVDVVTVSSNPMKKLFSKIKFSLEEGTLFQNLMNRKSSIRKGKHLKFDLCSGLGVTAESCKFKLKSIEHHRSHLASSFYGSDFKNATLLSVDGMGDFSSLMRAVGEGNKIQVLDTVSFPNSIGYFYTCFTQFLGFPYYGDEYKLMGLCAYGTPQEELIKDISDFLFPKANGLFALNTKYLSDVGTANWTSISKKGRPIIKKMYSNYFVDKFGKPRQSDEELSQHHFDLAASVQKSCENIVFHVAEDLYKRTKNKNLCLAGGVAQNSLLNGKLLENTSFENIFIPPSAHDGGTSVGSVQYYRHHVLNKERNWKKANPFTGRSYSNEEIKILLRKLDLKKFNYQYVEESNIYKLICEAISRGKVIGWFQGRSEFGPRALGNRSILADPRNGNMRQIINSKIKIREKFRPFAPSILKEHVHDYFVSAVEVPYMEKVLSIKKDKHQVIPAVTHIDGTGRLQTVDKNLNPRFYRLIDEFNKLTGVPILLNTSFNENEPIVNSPEEAFACFQRTNMDMLVLENHILLK